MEYSRLASESHALLPSAKRTCHSFQTPPSDLDWMRPTTVNPAPRCLPSGPVRLGGGSSRRSACWAMLSRLTPSRTRVALQKPQTETMEVAPRKRTGAPHDGHATFLLLSSTGFDTPSPPRDESPG